MTRVESMDLLAIEGAASIAVAGVTTVWGKSFKVPIKRAMSLEAKFTSSGTVEVDVDLEYGNVALTAGQENLTNANYVVPVGESAIISAAAAQVYIGPFSPTAAKYARVKLTGSGSNHASTVCDRLILAMAEDN